MHLPPIPIIPFFSKRKEKVIKEGGYNVFGKPIRKKKYVKLNVNALSKSNAQSLGAYLTDTSLSTNFFIKKTMKESRPPKLLFPKGYFIGTQHKFRDYRIRKGKRIPMKNKWIEMKGLPRLDTESEIRKIGLLSRLSKLKRKSGVKKKKGKKKKLKVKGEFSVNEIIKGLPK